jgi:heat shock protein HtpX
MKRIALFLATNLAIMLVLSVSMRMLGVEPYLNANALRAWRQWSQWRDRDG